ncbi:hypothetical protein K501DRAFT_90482 [Backusella circina FSU 941]|nr:hypothetical protein K501DRAFT_90482 [Backusella circina FSU 941]
MCTADNDESMLSSIIKVDAHYHQEPRREGSDFKAESIVIENGNPVIKSKFKDKFKYNKPAFMHEENRGYVKSGGYYNDKHDNSYSGNRGTKSNQRYSPYSKRTDYQSSSSSPYRNSNQYNSNNNNQHRNNNRYNSNNSNDRNRKKRWN